MLLDGMRIALTSLPVLLLSAVYALTAQCPVSADVRIDKSPLHNDADGEQNDSNSNYYNSWNENI